MDIKVIVQDSKKLVGISWSGSYKHMDEVSMIFSKLEPRIYEIENKIDNGLLFCPYHDRKFDFTYYAAIEVTAFDNIPDEMVSLVIPKQKYITTTHFGPNHEVQETYQSIFEWMEHNQFQRDPLLLSIEVYDKTKQLRYPNEFQFDIYVPVLE